MSAITITVTGNAELPSLPIAVQNAFNLNSAIGPTAVGVQLDILGKYIGLSRNGFTFSGPVTLNDADYLTMLLIKITWNSLKTDLSTVMNFLYSNFPNVISLTDYKDMSIDYTYLQLVGAYPLAEFFITAGLLPRPMGVAIRGLIYNPSGNYFFGFRTYDAAAYHQSGFNTYDSYSMTAPYLNYNDVITP